MEHRTELLSSDLRFNINNKYYYEVASASDYEYEYFKRCIDRKLYLRGSEIKESYKSDDMIKDGFKKMNDNDDSDFLFYVQPFDHNYKYLDHTHTDAKKNLESLKKINIDDKRFINLAKNNIGLKFLDAFHTSDGGIAADILARDIIIKIINIFILLALSYFIYFFYNEIIENRIKMPFYY